MKPTARILVLTFPEKILRCQRQRFKVAYLHCIFNRANLCVCIYLCLCCCLCLCICLCICAYLYCWLLLWVKRSWAVNANVSRWHICIASSIEPIFVFVFIFVFAVVFVFVFVFVFVLIFIVGYYFG